MKYAFVGMGSLVLATALLWSAQEDPVKTLMKAKTGYAHRLLDAVVLQDYDTIRDQAFRLKAVAETGDWNVLDTPEYARESEAFIHAAESLETAAGKRDGEAAALAYMDVTLKCVQCHRYMKAHRARN
jgi:hypothetical protein